MSAILMALMHDEEIVPVVLKWNRNCRGKAKDQSDPTEKQESPLPTWKDLSYKLNKMCLVFFSLFALIAIIILFGTMAA